MKGNHSFLSGVGFRVILGFLFAALYLSSVFVSARISGPDLLPDSLSYIEFSTFRQPLYGIWANALYALADSWEGVKVLQVGVFALCVAWIVVELAMISTFGLLAALAFVVAQIAFNRLGLLDLVAGVISEGLFYPMIMLMVAMFLAWLRTRYAPLLIGLIFLLVAMTQLRTAAMLVAAVPVIGSLYMLVLSLWRKKANPTVGIIIGAFVVAIAILPPLFGKAFLQLSTVADSTGFALLPRVSLLPVPQRVAEKSPDWLAMSSTWRASAEKLNMVEVTQFDAQLQEAIRYHLAPKLLLPDMLDRSSDEVRDGWAKGIFYSDAKRIATEWIIEEWPSYIYLTGAHMWGLLTMANFMDDPSRKRVWKALNTVSSQTWQIAPFRTDYPLNNINKPLSPQARWLYFIIRYCSIAVIAIGVGCLVILVIQSIADRKFSSGCLAAALSFGWVIAHSIPAAFLVFPEFRYTYANMLVMFSGAAAWFAYLGASRNWLTRP